MTIYDHNYCQFITGRIGLYIEYFIDTMLCGFNIKLPSLLRKC